jgi:penicillin amidase
MVKYEEIIKVKGRSEQDFVKLPIYLTPNGPLLSEIMPERKGNPLSLYWTLYDKNNNPLLALYKMSRANNINEFENALQHVKAPGLNMTYADAKGNIAWWVVGLIPIREGKLTGDLVLDGDEGLKGIHFLPFSENPHQINPPSGIIISANGKPPITTKERIEGYWRPAERYQHIFELLNEQERWDIEDLKKVQTSEKDISYREVLPFLLEHFDENLLARYISVKNLSHGLIQEALGILKAWHGSSSKNEIGITLYTAWNDAMMEILVGQFMKKNTITPSVIFTIGGYFIKTL